MAEKEDGAISTIVLRGSTDNLMDDIERAVDDGVNTFKVLTRVSICNFRNCDFLKTVGRLKHENLKIGGLIACQLLMNATFKH